MGERNFEIREANKEDAEFSLELEEICMKDHAMKIWGTWRPSSSRTGFEPDSKKVLLLDGEAVGIASWEEHTDHLFLSRIFLSPKHQSRGLGKMVMDHLKTLAADLPIRLSVLAPNTGAVRFYEREGFAVDSVSPERTFMSFTPEPAAGIGKQ